MKLCKIGTLMLLSTLFVVLLGACGTLSGSTSPSTLTLDANSAATQMTIATLNHNPVGTTKLTWDPKSETLTVTIKLTGLAPNSSHAAHIHAGTCAADGPIVYTLNSVNADAKGDATSKTVIMNVRKGIPATGWYINVHNGINMMRELDHRPISCGNIVNDHTSHETLQSVRVQMQGTTAPNESARGKATLTFVKGGKYVLKITLSGLVPNTDHAAHIHAGSCAAQGKVIVMLSPVHADDDGNGTSLTTLEHLPFSSTPMYINVHTGASMAQLQEAPTLFNPIACGNLDL